MAADSAPMLLGHPLSPWDHNLSLSPDGFHHSAGVIRATP